jgi:hypothetical protein
MSHSMQLELGVTGTTGTHPTDVAVVPALTHRNRLTSAFRIFLAIPHLILVGGPVALGLTFFWPPDPERVDWTAGGGVLGAAVMVVAMISWFAITFTGRMPEGLRKFSIFYLRWRVRAVAYTALLRDEYPPFGEGFYMAELAVAPPPAERNRLSVAFRILLAIPHLVIVWLLGVAWLVTTVFAWFAIVFTGTHPRALHDFGVGVLRWSTNVEAYLLLLHDEYPPFSLTPA